MDADAAPPEQHRAGLPPVLLTMPTYGGTLAAVRALGAAGAKVTVAGSGLLAPSRWSRHAARFVRCPDPRNTDAFLTWLLRFGRRHPGHFLYPTSDELSWLFAARAGELGEHFLLLEPPVQTLVQLLDKKRLYAACAAAGVPTLPTWFPSDVAEVEQLAASLTGPVVVKPRTQVRLLTQNHGEIVRDPRALPAVYAAWLRRDRFLPGAEQDFGDLHAPFLQKFSEGTSSSVYSMSGFVDRSGELLAVRAARKILQRPRGVGIGLCFEDAEVRPALAAGIARLCRSVGYFGVFEVEFISDEGALHLIDFNPRYYGQMQFEISRGMPLPLLALLAAQGELAGLASLARRSAAEPLPGAVYCFGFSHRMVLQLRRLAGTDSVDEQARWRAWFREHRGRLIDPSADRDDRLPGMVSMAAELWSLARHARGYVRSYVLDRG